MTPRKEKYALEELWQIRHETTMYIQDRFTEQEVRLTSEERWVLMYKVPFRAEIRKVRLTDLIVDVFDFSDFEKAKKVDQTEIDKRIEKLGEKYRSIKDTVALGDEDNAIALLIGFRTFCTNLKEED